MMIPSTVKQYSDSLHTCRKWSCIVGAFLLGNQCSMAWYWGNMSIYILSFVLKYQPSTSSMIPSLVLPLIVITICLAFMICDVLTRHICKRITIIAGTVVLVASFVAEHFVVQMSLIGTCFVLGVLVPLGALFSGSLAIVYAIEWAGEDIGILSSLVLSGPMVGGIFMNEIITLYVNPDNLKADHKIGPMTFFSQDEVIDRIPSLFLVLALVSLGNNILGFILVSDNPRKPIMDKDNPNQPVTRYSSTESNIIEIAIDKQRNGSQTTEHIDRTKPSTTGSWQSKEESPKEVIRTLTFYIYLFLFLMMEIPYVILTTYYKVYGQLYISDDHYLTNTSTALLLFSSISMFLWGMTLDKYGLQTTFIIQYSGSAVIVLCFFFAPTINKWVYVGITLIFGAVVAPIFVIFTFAVVKSYGRRFSLFNLGLVCSPSFILAFTVPPIIDVILTNLGWFYVFLFSSCCSVSGLFAAVLFVKK